MASLTVLTVLALAACADEDLPVVQALVASEASFKAAQSTPTAILGNGADRRGDRAAGWATACDDGSESAGEIRSLVRAANPG